MTNKTKIKTRRAARRRRRVRSHILGNTDKPRMTVAKSLNNIYVQIIDDMKRITLVGLSTGSKTMSEKFTKDDSKTEKARKLGQAIAELAKEKGIQRVVFDRNHFRYHGRVKAVADGAREKGLEL